MKNTSRNHRFKPSKSVAIGLLLLVFVGGTLFVLEKTGVTDFVKAPGKSTTVPGPTKEQQEQAAKADAESKQAYLDSTKDSTTTDSDSSVGSSTQSAASASMTVSASQSGSSVTVLTQIQGVSGGSCKLTVTNGTAATSQTAQIMYQDQFSSCAGFSVPTSSVGSGSWNIAVTITPTSGSSMTKSTTLEVK